MISADRGLDEFIIEAKRASYDSGYVVGIREGLRIAARIAEAQARRHHRKANDSYIEPTSEMIARAQARDCEALAKAILNHLGQQP